MAAASSDVSGSKSGKGSARLADGEDYDWAVGHYTECLTTGLRLVDGELLDTKDDCNTQELVIERLGNDPKGLTFQASFQLDGPPVLRYIYEAVGSYNRRYSDEIMFYTDHVEQLVAPGTWETLNSTQASDVSTLRVSQLDGDTTSVVADFYENEQIDFIPNVPLYQYEAMATYFFTDVDTE